MGVPKFYRWISERYPCLSEVVKEHQIPDFDNLYLDMNGVVHMCSHPEDDNPHFRITEQKIFEDIFHYLEVLFRMIKPKKVFFMAIDGVAPRAKMNQQRGRRFRSAREAEELIKRAEQKGEVLPSEERFDSNCITPGTPFMVNLQEQLKYFIVNKLSTDPMWQGTRILLSGHETPGEGEHKIMDFIRSEKSKPDYDPNTRHCLYGLDADLIMLGLTSHEPHFSLLREEVRFGGKKSQKRMTTVEETTFHLLHLSLMREYLAFEFSPVKNKLPFAFDMEKIIDDWVLLGFLVGNDFIPHLPHMHIKNDALPLLWKTYMDILPTLDGYINDGGKLNLPRFEKFLGELAKFDLEKFNDEYADLKYFQAKTGRKTFSNTKPGPAQKGKAKGANGLSLTNDFGVLEKLGGEFDMPPGVNGNDEEDEYSDGGIESSDSDSEDMFDMEFRQHKRNYYMDKMRFEHVTPDVLEDQAHGYVRAIQWILLYYYDGVPSWSWFYPYHYAPYISDVKNFKDMDITFDIATPFLPFQQLMAVLPAASKKLLPKAYVGLMLNDNSPVIDFYPQKFETDLNGKQQDWEAVVLIPFIDEGRLLAAMRSVEQQLTDDERKRNRHGPCRMYEYTPEPQQRYPSSMPGSFPDIIVNHAKITEFDHKDFVVPRHKLQKGLCPGVKLDVYFPGFPTMKHLPHSAQLKKTGVKVFQMNSRGENMMVTIQHEQGELDVGKIAKELIGQTIFVEWPHLYEAKVESISTDSVKYISVETCEPKSKSKGGKKRSSIEMGDLQEDEHMQWHTQVKAIKEKYFNRLGVVIGETKILVNAWPIMGRKYICGAHGKITLEKQWANTALPYVYQATVKDIASHDPTFHVFESIHDLFPTHGDVFMLGQPHYGCMGEVLEIDPAQSGRIRVELSVLHEPNMNHISTKYRQHMLQWMPGYSVAQKIGISGHLVSRITGCIFIVKGSKDNEGREEKVNVGLNLKSKKKMEEVPSYTKLVGDGWLYSNKTVDVLAEYIEKFPGLFDLIGSGSNSNDMYYESDIFGDSDSSLREVDEYLKKVPCADVPRMHHGCELLEEPAVAMIEEEVEKIKEADAKKRKHVRVQVRPHLLFRPLKNQGTLVPEKTAEYALFDRVVNVRLGYSVPLGVRGTVIGIIAGEREQDVIYEVIFDESFRGGINIRAKGHKCYRLPPCALINLTHGQRKESGTKLPPPLSAKSSNDQRQQQPKQQYGSPRRAWGQDREYNGADRGAGPSRDYYNNSSRGYQGRGQNDWEGRDQGNWSGGYQGRGQNGRDESWNRKGAGGHQGSWSQNQEREGLDQGAWNKKAGFGHSGSGSRDNYTNSANRGGPRQNAWQEKQQRPQQEERDPQEERNIWEQLQANTSKSQGQSQGKGPKRQGKGEVELQTEQEFKGASLQTAAKALPTNIQPDMNMNKNTNLDGKNYEKKGVSPSDGKKIVDEFSAMLQSLEISDKQQRGGEFKVTAIRTRQESAGSSGLEVPGSRARLDSARSGDFSADEQSKDAKEATTALCQMLKIDAAANLDKPSETKNYGRKVSVDEFFCEAKRKTSANNAPAISELVTTSSLSAPQPAPSVVSAPLLPAPTAVPAGVHPGELVNPGAALQGQPVQQAGMAQPLGRQNKQQKVSSVTEVEEWCKSKRMPPPKFDYFPLLQGTMTHYAALITFSNGMKFQGSYAKSRERAAESVSSQAMLHLRGMHQAPVPYNMGAPMYGQACGPVPGGIGSANSAFRPVHPGQPQKGPQYGMPPFFQGNPATGAYGMPPFFQGGYPPHMVPAFMANQAGFQPGQRPAGPVRQAGTMMQPRPQGDLSYQQRHQEASLHPPANIDLAKSPDKANPFVPLQVTRKQTPQKSKRANNTEETTKPKSSPQRSGGNHMKENKSNNAGQPETVKQTSRENASQSGTARQDAHHKSSQSHEAHPKKKKAKSRLAANFGKMGQ
ncbi:5'-3' exoribonuclease 1-like isoform X2 [Lineus longissimus]|uniref:5'-3' exoribonuclease 1-like isoform X2 n=1 Tax=Lineus longissimus TaxID=88925 RepID=UPI002B4CE14D